MHFLYQEKCSEFAHVETGPGGCEGSVCAQPWARSLVASPPSWPKRGRGEKARVLRSDLSCSAPTTQTPGTSSQTPRQQTSSQSVRVFRKLRGLLPTLLSDLPSRVHAQHGTSGQSPPAPPLQRPDTATTGTTCRGGSSENQAREAPGAVDDRCAKQWGALHHGCTRQGPQLHGGALQLQDPLWQEVGLLDQTALEETVPTTDTRATTSGRPAARRTSHHWGEAVCSMHPQRPRTAAVQTGCRDQRPSSFLSSHGLPLIPCPQLASVLTSGSTCRALSITSMVTKTRPTRPLSLPM